MHLTRSSILLAPLAPRAPSCGKRPQARGFALIEALVALLVLSVGLVGMTRLQTRSLQNNGSAYMRTQASLFSTELINRMRVQASSLNGGDLAEGVPIPECDTSVNGTLAHRLSRNLPDASVTCSIENRWLTIAVEWSDTRWDPNSDPTTFRSRTKL